MSLDPITINLAIKGGIALAKLAINLRRNPNELLMNIHAGVKAGQTPEQIENTFKQQFIDEKDLLRQAIDDKKNDESE